MYPIWTSKGQCLRFVVNNNGWRSDNSCKTYIAMWCSLYAIDFKLNPKPKISNPNSQTPIPKPQAPTPKPQTPTNPNKRTPNLKVANAKILKAIAKRLYPAFV